MSPLPARPASAPPQRPARARRAGAFTLLEVILAVSLMVLLMGAVCGFYHYAMGVRETLDRQVDTAFAQRRILDLIAADLHCCADVGLQFGFRGGPTELSLVRAVMPSASVYYTAPVTRAGDDDEQSAFALQHDVEMLRYFLPVDEESGEVGPLTRERLLGIKTGAVREGDVQSVALSRRVRFLHLQYRVGEEWAESWDGSGLPAAVRIALGTLPLPEGTEPADYPYETIWREVAIPAGGATDAAATPTRRSRP